jgi:putative FmdB family regulatory protein
MPTYDYRCGRCDHKFTVLTSISEKDKVICPQCRSRDVNQLFTGCGVKKGNGSSCDLSGNTKRFGGG